MKLESKIPEGPLAEKWTKHKFNLKLVNPANKRKYDVIVVGTGLAGASGDDVPLGYRPLHRQWSQCGRALAFHDVDKARAAGRRTADLWGL